MIVLWPRIAVFQWRATVTIAETETETITETLRSRVSVYTTILQIVRGTRMRYSRQRAFKGELTWPIIR
jgi:hypothetical protein